MSPFTATIHIQLNASITEVWDALLNPEKVKRYFFGTDLQCDWNIGSPIFFRGVWEGKPYEDKGIILLFLPQKTLKYSYWSSFSGVADVPANQQIITYTVAQTNGGTLLTITQENCLSEETQKHSKQNWNMVLNSMKEMLEGRVTPPAQ